MTKSRYKDMYPTFWDYLFKNWSNHEDAATNARNASVFSFLKLFCKSAKWKIKTNGLKKFLHDNFVGTRIL